MKVFDVFPKTCASQIWQGGQCVPIKKLLTLETSKNHVIRNFLRDGRVSVKVKKINLMFSTNDLEYDITTFYSHVFRRNSRSSGLTY